MNKKILYSLGALVLFVAILFKFSREEKNLNVKKQAVKKKKKTPQQRMIYAKEREKHELNFQINPLTGKIPFEEKKLEFRASVAVSKLQGRETSSNSYVFRGPSNFGGRTRALVVDVSDATSQTIIAGGVSAGVFRTTNGGKDWTKVSSNNEIHNATAIAQDPRKGFQNIWYYATGEWGVNSASLGSSPYSGQGVWKSTNGGVDWSMIPITNSKHHLFDSFFDYTMSLSVSPINGDLFIATVGKIYRYDGTDMKIELEIPYGRTGYTDVEVASNGRVFASIQGTSSAGGVWTSKTGNGSWERIAKNGSPTNWNTSRRIVLGVAKSNSNIVYALYDNGKVSKSDAFVIEADLWRYDVSSKTWTDFSYKLPDEPNGDSLGNDPFAVQGGYDIEVAVKPDDENFVLIGGTNAYRINNINTDATFFRIGGYKSNISYGPYNEGGVNHHPDIHALVFDPNNYNIVFSGTDGGVHKTTNIKATKVAWESLNNNYRTYQYYHVAIDPDSTKDIVIGGAQDNGTTIGGLDEGLADKTTMKELYGGDGVAVGIGRLASNMTIFLGYQYGAIFRKKDEYEKITPKGSSSQFVTYFYLDPDNNNALYYAGKNTLYMTKDSENVTEKTWVNLGSLPTSEKLRTFATTRGAYNPKSSYLFIGGDRGGVFRVKDPQNQTDLSTAVNITPPTATTARGSIVSGIAVHPTNPDIMLVVYGNYGIENIFLTKNATATNPSWTLVERNLENHSIRSAAIAQVGSETIYFVGTARGLYSSKDPITKAWDIEGSNKVGLAVVSSLAYRPKDNRLLVGTHGNGMFETVVKGTLSSSKYSKNSLGLTLYPNPVVERINFKGDLLNSGNSATYEIYDIMGKSVKKGKIINQQINVGELSSGAYIINVTSKNKKQSLKFLKK